MNRMHLLLIPGGDASHAAPGIENASGFPWAGAAIAVITITAAALVWWRMRGRW